MIGTVTKVGPQDHGRPMRLAEFEPAEGVEGFLYELGRGVVAVMDVPHVKHLRQVNETRMQLSAHQITNPGQIYVIASGNECKILLSDLESERHPDLAVYKTPPPNDPDLWAIWIPELAIEVVSPGSEIRDYVEKREEYLAFGIKEYWIIDAAKREVLVLRRSRGKWVEQILKPGDICETKLLPGFKFDCARVFEAAESV
jgi:Uma2 family endonuclease